MVLIIAMPSVVLIRCEGSVWGNKQHGLSDQPEVKANHLTANYISSHYYHIVLNMEQMTALPWESL